MLLRGVTGWRIALTLVVLGYAVLALGSGLDRLSGANPSLERVVPGPFRAQAERSAAQLSLARQQSEPALRHARLAVAADPVDAASVSLLGTSLLLRNDFRGADQAFRVAARIGWRDTATQLYWFEAAFQAGDEEAAADRLDALLRTHRGLPQIDALLARLEASPEGRQALVRRMADRPAWLTGYLAPSGLSPAALSTRATVLADLARSGTRLGCDAITPFVSGALAGGGRSQAEQVWQAHCPQAKIAAGLADGGFEAFGRDPPYPFGWQARPSGDVTIETVGAPREGRALELRNTSSFSRLVLVQQVALAPGSYRLRGSAPPGRIAASLSCGGDPTLPSGVAGDIGGEGQILTVPECARLALGLWLKPGRQPARLDDLSLERVR